jgi:hypothetical protein
MKTLKKKLVIVYAQNGVFYNFYCNNDKKTLKK